MLVSLRFLPKFFSPDYWKRMWAEVILVFQLMKDGRVPLYLKGIPFLVGIYLLSPFDLIPGFLPIVGQMDDFGLLMIGLSAFIRMAPADVVDEYMPEGMRRPGEPKEA